MKEFLSLFLFLASIFQTVTTQTVPDGNACYSRFDYESKMLERIVMVEHRMNVLQENTKKELDQFQSEMRHMKKEQNVRHLEMTRKFEVLEEKLTHAQALKLQELTMIGDDLKNTSDNMILQNQRWNEEMDVKFESISEKLADNIATKHADVVGEIRNFTADLQTQHQTKLDEMTALEKDLREMSDTMKEEQSLKLMVLEAIGDEIKLDVQERMVKLEVAEKEQQVEYDRVYNAFEEKVKNTWNEIKVSGLGIKSTVAFNVRDVANSRPSNGAIVQFSYELVNTDSVYDTSTGVFTAPVNGTYIFSVQICGDGNAPPAFRIVVNDVDYSESSTISSYHMCTTSNAIASLKQGDRAWVKNSFLGYYNGVIQSTTNRRSAFMGALVH